MVSQTPAEQILSRADRSRVEARALYAKTYDRDVNDPANEEELERVLRAHKFGRDDDLVAVPARLLLAFVLKPRGRGKGRGRPKQERLAKRWNALVVRVASGDWAERVASGEDSKRAKHAAAIKAARSIFGHNLAVSTIELRMRLRKTTK